MHLYIKSTMKQLNNDATKGPVFSEFNDPSPFHPFPFCLMDRYSQLLPDIIIFNSCSLFVNFRFFFLNFILNEKYV